jgi:hypothetical protein
MVPVHQLGIIIMSLLTENQLTDIVDMIVDDYGTRLAGGEVSEFAGLILENISGFETADSQTLTQYTRLSVRCLSPYKPRAQDWGDLRQKKSV